jgi:alpha-L-fucosidase 2
MVFGGVEEDRIVLNESSVWSGSPQNADREGASAALPEIRKLLLEGKNPEAEALVNQHFTCVQPGSGGGSGANTQFGCYQVLGNLHIKSGHGPVWSSPSGHDGQPGQGISQSTDGDPKTKWCFEHAGANVQWMVELPKDAKPSHYRFTSADDMPERDPQQWKLEGSRDGKTWVILDERQGQKPFDARFETKSYEIAKPGSCRFFRFTFPPNPGVPHFQIAEIDLDGIAGKVRHAGYRRSLDLQTATAGVSYQIDGVNYERTHFVSAPDEVFVSRYTASKPGSLDFTVSLDRPERATTRTVGQNELLMTGTLNDGKGGSGLTHVTRVRLISRGGTVTADGDNLLVKNADEVLIYVAAATDYRGFAGRVETGQHTISDPAMGEV